MKCPQHPEIGKKENGHAAEGLQLNIDWPERPSARHFEEEIVDKHKSSMKEKVLKHMR